MTLHSIESLSETPQVHHIEIDGDAMVAWVMYHSGDIDCVTID